MENLKKPSNLHLWNEATVAEIGKVPHYGNELNGNIAFRTNSTVNGAKSHIEEAIPAYLILRANWISDVIRVAQGNKGYKDVTCCWHTKKLPDDQWLFLTNWFKVERFLTIKILRNVRVSSQNGCDCTWVVPNLRYCNSKRRTRVCFNVSSVTEIRDTEY